MYNESKTVRCCGRARKLSNIRQDVKKATWSKKNRESNDGNVEFGDDPRCLSMFSGLVSGVPSRAWRMIIGRHAGKHRSGTARGAALWTDNFEQRFPDVRRPKRNGCILQGHCQDLPVIILLFINYYSAICYASRCNY